MQVFFKITACHAIDISGISLSIGTASQRIGLHGEFLCGAVDIGISHSVAVGAA